MYVHAPWLIIYASSSNPKTPVGLTYHLLDIYLDELHPYASELEFADSFLKIFDPIRTLSLSAPTKSMRRRAKTVLQDASEDELISAASRDKLLASLQVSTETEPSSTEND